MNYVRTQVYLLPQQHKRLKEAARRQKMTMTALLRQIVDEYLEQMQEMPSERDYLAIVGLGASGQADISERHDDYLVEALADEGLR